jgi:CDP-diacylglycerol--glycerol-3-phosphate 3-phosphatidyltransferase
VTLGGVRLLPARVVTGFPRVVRPVAEWLIRLGVRPNAITSGSALVVVAAGAAFGLGAVRLAAVCLLASGLLDVLDGAVARRGGMTSTFGAFLDSTLDRVGDAALFAGIAVYLRAAAGGALSAVGLLAVLAALTGSLLVSYTRARAEGLGIVCGQGIAQRAERILGIAVPTLIFGAGPGGILLLAIVLLLALVSWVTVVQRVVLVYRATVGARTGRGALTGKSGTVGPVTSGPARR